MSEAIELHALRRPPGAPGDGEDDARSGVHGWEDAEQLLPAEAGVAEGGEKLCTFVSQVLPSLMLSGCGMAAAGLLLDHVQHWDVFIIISELFILVPALLGLKGNLEMTMAARLSTAANRGDFVHARRRWEIILHNLAVIQIQAITVGFSAAIFSTVAGVLMHQEFDIRHALVISAASVATASMASLVLGTVMCSIVVLTRHCGVNPDNVATPIAAALGDLVTLSMLAGIAELLFRSMDKIWPSVLMLFLFLLLLVPLLWFLARGPYEYLDILQAKSVWVAILSAVCISSLGGTILERFVVFFPGEAVLSPIMNGLGGNLAAVHASRASTSFHTTGAGPRSSRPALMLLLLAVPLALVFLIVIGAIGGGHTSITPMFITGYSLASLLQVGALLWISSVLVKTIWSMGLDPDNVAIPFVTALGDLLGTALLTLTFMLLWQLGDQDADVGE